LINAAVSSRRTGIPLWAAGTSTWHARAVASPAAPRRRHSKRRLPARGAGGGSGLTSAAARPAAHFPAIDQVL